jgi:hypothetical protein
MKILFDLSAAQPAHGYDFHGGSEYAKTVFYTLCKGITDLFELDVFYDLKVSLDNNILQLIKGLGLKEYFCKDAAQISLLLKKNRYDVFYTALPYSYQDVAIPRETKFIYTIHGLRSLEYPWDKYAVLYKKWNFKKLLKNTIIKLINVFSPEWYINHVRAKNKENFVKLFSLTKNQSVITVSAHTKYSLSYFFPGMDLSSIKILYSPQKSIEKDHTDETAALAKYSLTPRKYILLIGGDRYEKGTYLACGALYKLLLINANALLRDIKIIVLGVSNKRSFENLTKKSERFIYTGYVPSLDLEVLYKNAHLFMYPTLNEGFGYPPLEAMKYGVLCACSANSAVTEICADSVLYFNPHDDVEIGIRVLQSFDSQIHQEKTERMRERVKKIAAKQDRDLDVLVDIIKGN